VFVALWGGLASGGLS
jgi:hypothetical protein